MHDVLHGGCQCGAVRFRVTGSRPPVYVCHCRECQKQSASAFGISLSVKRDQISIEGTLDSWERDTDSGARTRSYFCPVCGSRVYHQSNATPDSVTVKCGSLDDTSWLLPTAHIWVSRKQPWVTLDPAVPTHPMQPDDLVAWRAALVGATE